MSSELIKFLASFGAISGFFLFFFHVVFKLGKKESEDELKHFSINERYKKLKAIRKTEKWISTLSLVQLYKLLRRRS